jgi:probable HAF family extracellular repeat protein
MKSLRLTGIIAMTLFALAMPVSLAAQDNANRHSHHKHHHYQLIDIGTFGGPNSSFAGNPPEVRLLNNSGAAVGGADTPTPDPSCINFNFDCYLAYGFKWQDGVAHELSALPGFNSSFAVWVSDTGLVAGLSQNGIDPLTGGPAFEAILWGQDGSITDLGTLGGNQSIANAVNNRSQVAGVALNTIPDAYTSTGAFAVAGATQAHAFRWTKSQGMQDLGTLGGTDSIAVVTNERGQIAGWSFTNTTVNPVSDSCGSNVPTEDPFIWKNGKMIDLGTLGGTCGQAYSLNNRGQVVGFSDVLGDSTEHPFLWSEREGMKDLGTLGGTFGHADYINDAGEVVGTATPTGDPFGRAFLWRNGVVTDLGTLGTDPDSEAFGVNMQGQVVGNTGVFGVVDHRAFLWEHGGPMVDLNTLIPSNPDLQLTRALYINDRGEIAAQGNFSNGGIHAFVLIPCDENHAGVEGCDYSMVDVATLQQSAPLATQHPAAGTPRSRMPAGMSNRFRSRWGQRTPGSVTNPATAAEQTSSANTGSVDLEGEQLLGSLYGRYKGYCTVAGGKLDGYCTAYGYYSCLAKVSTACPSGKTATKPGYFRCSDRFSRYVDLGRSCNFN